MSYPSRRLIGGLALLLSLFTAACGTTPASSAGRKVITVVAAENVWGSIASQVGGSHVKVASIINNPNTDPHDYEPTANDARTVAGAQYVIINGVGYDAWATKLVSANSVQRRKVLTIGDLVGKRAGDNPHLWYNPDYVSAVANQIRDDLKTLAPGNAAAFDQSAQAFETTGLARYHQLIAAIKAKWSGVPVGATESIFAYLAPALGLHLITPPSYLKAVSEGEDIAASDEVTVENQIKTKAVKVVVYNNQNTPNTITNLLNLAKASGIPTPSITETLVPATAFFQEWQVAQLEGIEAALTQATGSRFGS